MIGWSAHGIAEILRRRERRRVRLHLKVALVLEPVGDVDHERHEQDQQRQPDHHHDEHAAALLAGETALSPAEHQ